MSKIIGIDLGTTFSCVAVMEGGQAGRHSYQEGTRTTPSVVAFHQKRGEVCRSDCRRQAITNPENNDLFHQAVLWGAVTRKSRTR